MKKNEILTILNGGVYAVPARYNQEGKKKERIQIREEINNLVQKIKNSSNPADVDLVALQALSTVDIELQIEEMPDNIADQIVHDVAINAPNQAVSKKVVLREFLDPVAPFQEISGNNDSVPLMDFQAIDDTLDMKLYGIGFRNSILNEFANTTFDGGRVGRAVARWYVDLKNREFLAPIVAFNFGAANSFAKQNGAATFRERLFNTAEGALDKVYSQAYIATGGKVGDKPGEDFIICNPRVARALNNIDINRDTRSIAEALNVKVLSYGGAPGGTYGGIKWSPLNLPDNKFFVIHRPYSQESLLRVTGADLEARSGQGSALTGGSDEQAWFRYSGIFNKYFLPSASNSATAKDGCIISVEMPDRP